MKIFTIATISALALCAGGCAYTSARVTKTMSGTNVVHELTRFRSYQIFEAESALSKLSASQTEKGQKVGVGSLEGSATSTNAVAALQQINAILSHVP